MGCPAPDLEAWEPPAKAWRPNAEKLKEYVAYAEWLEALAAQNTAQEKDWGIAPNDHSPRLLRIACLLRSLT